MRFRAAPYNFFVCSRAQHRVCFLCGDIPDQVEENYIFIFSTRTSSRKKNETENQHKTENS